MPDRYIKRESSAAGMWHDIEFDAPAEGDMFLVQGIEECVCEDEPGKWLGAVTGQLYDQCKYHTWMFWPTKA